MAGIHHLPSRSTPGPRLASTPLVCCANLSLLAAREAFTKPPRSSKLALALPPPNLDLVIRRAGLLGYPRCLLYVVGMSSVSLDAFAMYRAAEHRYTTRVRQRPVVCYGPAHGIGQSFRGRLNVHRAATAASHFSWSCLQTQHSQP